MQNALLNFATSLQRIRDIANDVLANAPRALNDKGLRERNETVLSSVVVTMSGFFESFLREIAEQYVEAICQKKHPFKSLKQNIINTHFEGGGKILSAVAKKNPHIIYSGITAEDVAKRLSSVSAGPPYYLLWEAFADTKSNPNTAAIRDFLQRFGVEKPIDTLASHMSSPGNLSIALDSFISIRNECAHTGKLLQVPTASEVIGYCNLLENIATGIVSTLACHQVC